MTEEKAIPLLVRPTISYPQEAEVGESYLMTIDLDHLQEGDKWPYEEEEYPVYCMLQTSPLFTNKPVDTPAVVLHRFGGTYGPAKFVLTAAEKELAGTIRVALVNGQGVPLQVLESNKIKIVPEVSHKTRVVGTLEPKTQRSDTRKSNPSKKPVTIRERKPDKTEKKPSFYRTNHIDINQLRKDIRQALKLWHKEGSTESPLHYLSLFHQFRRQRYSIHKATHQVILEGLAVLEEENPRSATFLRKRYIDEESIHNIANYFNISESYVYNLQRTEINHLAEILKEIEETTISVRQEVLQARLELPTYSLLIGVEQHLSTLRQMLIAQKRPWIVSIEGIGGIGKTSLADALLREIISQGLFDNFGWVSARQETLSLGGDIKRTDQPALTVDGLVEQLVLQLLGFTPAQLSGKQAFEALRYCLKERPHLIVIDNLETLLDVESLFPTLHRLANPSKFLLTSHVSFYGRSGVYHFVVPSLTASDALRLVREEARECNLTHLMEASDQELQPIYETVGGNPLALRLVVGQTALSRLDVILDDLKTARGEKAEDLYTHIYRPVWDNLDDVTRTVFMFLPLALDQGNELDFLQAVTGLEYRDIRRALDLLITLNLVELRGEFGERRYTIHNLTRTFLQEQVIKWQ